MNREEALRRVKGYLTDYLPIEDSGELDEIMEALEQEPILDKIRAEIEAIIDHHNHNVDDYDFCSGLIRARNIIDKYRKEN